MLFIGLFLALFFAANFALATTSTITCDTTSALTIPGAQNPYYMNFNCAVPSAADTTASLEISWASVGDHDGRDYFRCGSNTIYTTADIVAPYPNVALSDVSACLRGYNLTTGSRICTANAWNTNCPGYYYGLAAGHSTMEYARLTVTYSDTPPTTYTLTYTAGDHGSISGSSPQTVNSGSDGSAITATADEGYYFVNWSDDSTDNPRTDTNVTGDISVTANFALSDTDAPVISGTTVYTSSTGAIITWDTDENASALVNYGLASSVSVATDETDTDPRDKDHSITISNLVPCTRYYYKAESTDSYANTGYSSVDTFKTTGCTGKAEVVATEQTEATGSQTSLKQGNISLTIPANFKTGVASAYFQANKLDNTSFISEAGTPSGFAQLGTDAYTLKALSDEATSISTFTNPITVVLNYTASDLGTLDESSLWIYRYDGSAWYALDDCEVDTTAKTVSCTTRNFSDFAIFGQQGAASAGSQPVSTILYSGTSKPSLSLNQLEAQIAGLRAQIDALIKRKMMKNESIQEIEISRELFSRNLEKGMYGQDVRELQKFLNKNGFIISEKNEGSIGNETTYIGERTEAALIRFQEKNGISPAAGYFGQITRSFVSLE